MAFAFYNAKRCKIVRSILEVKSHLLKKKKKKILVLSKQIIVEPEQT